MACRTEATVFVTAVPSLKPSKNFWQNSTRPAPAMGIGVTTTWGTPSWARLAVNDITSFRALDDEALTNTTGAKQR